MHRKNKYLFKTTLTFKFAFEGIGYAIRTQRNLRIHIIIASLVLIASYFLRCTYLEFAIILLTIASIISFEMLNTAIEAAIDLFSPENQPLAKIAKDLGAASVLVSAAISVIIGILILGPKLFRLLSTLLTK